MNKKRLSKGDRLNWTPLKEVEQVNMNTMNIKGHVLTADVLKLKKIGTPKTVFVP